MSTYLVLAVEHDLSNQLSIKRAIAGLDRVDVVIVNTGGDAVDYLARTGPYKDRDVEADPDLVLAGHDLPDMFAFELVRRARSQAEGTEPPIFVYTKDFERESRTYEGLPNCSLSAEPLDEKDFQEAVSSLVLEFLAS